MKAVFPWLAGLTAVALVAGAAWAGWTYFPPPKPAAPREPDPFAPVERAALKPDHDYVVLVRAVEVAPTGLGGKTWERGFDDGPDLAYDLSWRGNVIFQSTVADDALIGRWEALNVDLMDTIQSGGDVDLGKALNNGAVVRTPPAPQTDGSAVDPPAHPRVGQRPVRQRRGRHGLPRPRRTDRGRHGVDVRRGRRVRGRPPD